MTERDDFVDLISGLTDFIQNERVRAYNEGVDMMFNSVREWMRLRNYRADGDNLPDLLDCLMRQVDSDAPTFDS